MKNSSIRLKLISSTLGVLLASVPVLTFGEGQPVGEGAVPVGEGAVPIGEGAVPIGEGAVPVGEGAVPVGEGAVPIGESAVPIGEGAVPVGEGAVRVGEGAVPVGEGAVRVGEGAVPVGEGAVRVGEGAVRVGEGAVPIGEGAVSNKQAQKLRLDRRAAAMVHPATSSLFGSEPAPRQAAAGKRLTSAIGEPSTLTGLTLGQRAQEDRQWALSVLKSAAARPADLFTTSWWSEHSKVLAGPNCYYNTKPAYVWWQGSNWSDLIRSLEINDLIMPTRYLNDMNITYNNDVIYVNGKPVSSYEDFVASARSLANSAATTEPANPRWSPLGTYAVSSSFQQQNTSHAIQLALDTQGNIAGVYVNWPQGDVIPIRGKVDMSAQRVAFNIGSNNKVTLETGLANLTDEQTRIWAHLPNQHSQTWLMVRIHPAGN